MVYRREVAVQDNYPKKFERSKAALDEDSFSLHAFLRRSENLGYRALDSEAELRVSTGLTAKLLPFQRDTVQFMVDRATTTR